MKIGTHRLFKAFLFFLLFSLIMQSVLYSQTGSFSKNVSQDGWSGNVEFNVPAGSGVKPLIIGLHPAQTPGFAIRDMLKASSDKYKAILVCPDGADGSLSESIIPLINYCKKTYNIDESKIILSGYSAGGYTTFSFGPTNYQLFKGLIGIAAYGNYMSQEAVNALPVGMICGTSDQTISGCRSFRDFIESNDGQVKLIEKAGVGHTGQYFYSSEFSDDWNECYDFIMNFIPKPGQIILSSPYNGAEDVEIPVILEWNEDPKSNSYEVEINGPNGYFKSLTPSVNLVSIKTLDPGAEYTWMVRGVNDGGAGQWSLEFSFTTMPVPPSAPVSLIEPLNEAVNLQNEIDFKWGIIEGATSYHLQVFYSNDTLFREYEDIEPEFEEVEVIKTVRNLDLETQFKWRVRGKNSAGEAPWSDFRTFITIMAPPANKVELSGPDNNAIDVSTTPIFSWGVIEKAEYYHLQILPDEGEEPILEDSLIIPPNGGGTIEYNFTSELDGTTNYKWQVCGRNVGGRGPWSEKRLFTTWDPTNVTDGIKSIININLKPNPVNENSILTLNLRETEQVYVDIYNYLGEKVMNVFSGRMESGETELKPETSSLNNGAYFYSIRVNSRVQNIGFIIQR